MTIKSDTLLNLQGDLLERRELEHALVHAAGDERALIQKDLYNVRRRIKRSQTTVAQDYPVEYTDCRDLGHMWVEDYTEMDEEDNLLRMLRCDRCSTFRQDRISAMGATLRRRYVYNEDYTIPTGNQLRKQFWRGLAYMRAR